MPPSFAFAKTKNPSAHLCVYSFVQHERGNGNVSKGTSFLNPGYRVRQGITRGVFYLLLVGGMLVMMFPFYWMISSSFKTAGEMSLFPPTFAPRNWLNFNNYRLAFQTAPFARYFLNSVMVTREGLAMGTITFQRYFQLVQPSTRADQYRPSGMVRKKLRRM